MICRSSSLKKNFLNYIDHISLKKPKKIRSFVKELNGPIEIQTATPTYNSYILALAVKNTNKEIYSQANEKTTLNILYPALAISFHLQKPLYKKCRL